MPAHTVGRMGGSAFASKKSATAAAHSKPEKSNDTTIHTHTIIQTPIIPTYSAYVSQPLLPTIPTMSVGVAFPIDFSLLATFIAVQIVMLYIVNRKY